MLNAVRVSTLLVAIVLILVVGAFRHFGCCTGELPTAGTPCTSAIRMLSLNARPIISRPHSSDYPKFLTRKRVEEISQDGENPDCALSFVSDGSTFRRKRNLTGFTIPDLSSDGGAPSSTSKGGDI